MHAQCEMIIAGIERRLVFRDTLEVERTVLICQSTQARYFRDEMWVRLALQCIIDLNEMCSAYVRGGGLELDSSDLSEMAFDHWFFDE